jgi:hypothetical protein
MLHRSNSPDAWMRKECLTIDLIDKIEDAANPRKELPERAASAVDFDLRKAP